MGCSILFYYIKFSTQFYSLNMTNSLKNLIHPDIKHVLDEIYQVSRNQKMQIYVVGGFVRDLILNKPGKDIDFVVIGDAIEFTQNIHNTLPVSEPVFFPKFILIRFCIFIFHMSHKDIHQSCTGKKVFRFCRNNGDFHIGLFADIAGDRNAGNTITEDDQVFHRAALSF